MATTVKTEDDLLILRESKINIAEETKEKLLSLVVEESQVIIHCKLFNPYPWAFARIWETTYLIDDATNHRSHLLFADGISKYPCSTAIPMKTTLYFTLIFSALPKSCKAFRLHEQTAGKTGFHTPMIKRNGVDVYSIDLSESIV